MIGVKGLGIALKLTFAGNNQFMYGSTWGFVVLVAVSIVTQMNYLNMVSLNPLRARSALDPSALALRKTLLSLGAIELDAMHCADIPCTRRPLTPSTRR